MKRQYLVCALLCLQLFAAVPGGAESPQKATVSMRPYKGTRAVVIHQRQHCMEAQTFTLSSRANSGFPVRLGGVGKPHAAFLKESRIRGR